MDPTIRRFDDPMIRRPSDLAFRRSDDPAIRRSGDSTIQRSCVLADPAIRRSDAPTLRDPDAAHNANNPDVPRDISRVSQQTHLVSGIRSVYGLIAKPIINGHPTPASPAIDRSRLRPPARRHQREPTTASPRDPVRPQRPDHPRALSHPSHSSPRKNRPLHPHQPLPGKTHPMAPPPASAIPPPNTPPPRGTREREDRPCCTPPTGF